jgi:sigma-B regulation protein RsbU (phosphoserine phosphatase)
MGKGTNAMRILIAEDERITRRSLQKQLESWGHEVIATEDGAEAWEALQQQPVDIVVTDWEMPRIDGRELIQRIRESDRASYAYLIMLTGRSEKSDLISGMEAGADDFLAKPFDRNELRVRLSAGERIIQLERTLAAQNEALQDANDRMTRDLNAAAELQRGLLPAELPVDLGATFAWHFEPCDELGGDILNVLPLNSHRVALYLLDVTGHGVPAALLSVTLSQVLTNRDPRASILVGHDPASDQLVVRAPGQVAAHLNRQFPMRAQGGRFFTMAYAVLDTRTGVLQYTSAGHMPPILMRAGQKPEKVIGSNLPIGVVEDVEFEEQDVPLEPGDRLFFYSDGITEAANTDKQMLQTEGLIELIEKTRTVPLVESLSTCVAEVRRWCGPVPIDDDISLLAVEMPPAPR